MDLEQQRALEEMRHKAGRKKRGSRRQKNYDQDEEESTFFSKSFCVRMIIAVVIFLMVAFQGYIPGLSESEWSECVEEEFYENNTPQEIVERIEKAVNQVKK